MTGQKFIKSGYKYTREEKLAIIKDYLMSDLSKNAIEKKYGISNGILSQWLRIFGADKNTKSSLAYSTLIDIAEKDFNIKIRKKDGVKQ